MLEVTTIYVIQMRSLRIKNLRILEDTGYIDLKPITLLLGGNSCGKSTFLRTLPLIRQSVETKTTGTILWFGDFVDFGSYQEAINKDKASDGISLSFRLQLNRNEFWYARDILTNTIAFNKGFDDLDVTIELKLEQTDDSTITKNCYLSFLGHQVEIIFGLKGEIDSFKVNDRELKIFFIDTVKNYSGYFLPLLKVVKPKDNFELSLGNSKRLNPTRINPFFYYSELNLQIKQTIKSTASKNISEETVLNIIRGISIADSEEMFGNLQKHRAVGKTKWEKTVSTWNENTEKYLYLRDLLVAATVQSILSASDKHLADSAQLIKYIAPTRATAKRFYRSQDLSVNEVDSQGINLPMFLRNLTEEELSSLSGWTCQNFGFNLSVNKISGLLVSIMIQNKYSEQEDNLADIGFGYSQILPILVQLWWLIETQKKGNYTRSIIFAIEQPELHLHPKLQALLADSFIKTINSANENGMSLKLILETHSETLVNRFGNLIAAKKIDKNDVNIVFFEKDEIKNSVVTRKAEYDDDGFLNNWPIGFFEQDIVI